MNDSQQKAITIGMFALAALLVVFSIIRFMAYFDYQGKLNQASAMMGADGREMARDMANATGQSVGMFMPLILLIAAVALGYIAFKRLGKA